MATGVYNPHKPGETVWLFGYKDLEGLIPDDIYEYISEVMYDADLEVGGLQDEVDEWEKWHDEYLHDEQAYLEDVWDDLEKMWVKLNDREKRLDRGDMISGFKAIREMVKDRLNNF